jgi:hypothetical protein
MIRYSTGFLAWGFCSCTCARLESLAKQWRDDPVQCTAVVVRDANVRGASKIKLKNVNKKIMATARRLIFLEYLKASIADLITLLFSSLRNSEGGGDSNSDDSFADPCQFLPFPKTKI